MEQNMKKLMTEYLINKENLNERIVYIKDSDDYYVSENGNIYREYQPNKFLKKKIYINPNNQYAYCGISYSGSMKTTRVHRLVAMYFVENSTPSNDIVGHKDNNKSNNVYTNLYWTNTSENTKKAFDDGLAYNAKGLMIANQCQ